MNEPQITIIGLGLIGGSIGLALQANDKGIRVVGHDLDHGINKRAQKMGAVDQSTFSLPDACENADLVVIATPITAIRETFETIGPHLKPGCVVTDTATLKEPVHAWAEQTLPEDIPFVGGNPLLNPAALMDSQMAPQGLESARPDLFQGAFYTLCPPADVAPTAVKRVADMATLLEARPFFTDPVEHDGIRAAVEGLPALVGLALMQTVGEAPGWREARKMADHVLGMATAPITGDGQTHRALALLNAPHLLPRLDAMIRQLVQLRQQVSDGEAALLEEAFNQTNTVRDQWLRERARFEWEEELGELSLPGALGGLGNVLGMGIGSGKRKED